MKRLHVSVDDLDQSVGCHSTLFAAKPGVVKPGCAKWMLDDHRVNFVISARGGKTGLDDLGIQVGTQHEPQEVCGRLKQADLSVLEEGATTCCCAQSEKSCFSAPANRIRRPTL